MSIIAYCVIKLYTFKVQKVEIFQSKHTNHPTHEIQSLDLLELELVVPGFYR